MNMKTSLRLLTVSLVTTVAAGAGLPAAAADVDTSSWACSQCPFARGLVGNTEAEGLSVSDESAKYGQYNGLDEDGGYGNANVDLRYYNEGGYGYDIQGRDLGLDTRWIDVEAGHQGRWSVGLSYDELPARYGYEDPRTVYRGNESANLRLADGWVRGGSTQDFPALDASLRGVDIKTTRETLGARAEFIQSPRLRYAVDYEYEQKDGGTVTWGSFLANSAELVKPVDYDTHEVDVAVHYGGDSWQASAGFYGSYFNSSDLGLAWENAFTGPDRGQMALAPDNSFNQFNLAGSFQLPFNTTASLRAAMGKMEQDDAYLPYTINPGLAGTALPRGDLDGEVDTTQYNVDIVSRPLPKLRLVGKYRYDDRDNDSSRESYDIVQADIAPRPAQTNLIYDFERTKWGASADYRFSRGTRGWIGWDREKEEFSEQSVDETEEDTIWGKIRARASDSFSLGAKMAFSDRDNNNYEDIAALQPPNNPLLRKYNLANRDRDAVEVFFDWQVTDRSGLSARFEQADDDYDNSDVGLVSADYENFTVDLNVQLRERISSYAFVAQDRYKSRQRGAQSGASPNTAPPNWQARNRDTTQSAGAGLYFDEFFDRWDVRLDYVYSDSEGATDVFNQGQNDSFPDFNSTLHSANLEVGYALNDRMRLRGGWRYEKLDTDDWSVDGVNPDTMLQVLTFGENSPDYDVNVFMIGFDYLFRARTNEDLWRAQNP